MQKHDLTAILLLLIGVIVLIGGCSEYSKPSKSVIESEFRHAWYSIHGEFGEKGYHWRLINLQIGGVSVDRVANTAKVSIKFTYETTGRTVT